MIDSKELRIGNNVDYNSKIIKVESILGCLSAINMKFHEISGDRHHEIGIEQIKPIQLNEEWKLKLGFERKGASIRLKIGDTGMELCYYDCEDKIRFQTRKSGFTIPMNIKEEVHIIQNLVFALTNEELTIK